MDFAFIDRFNYFRVDVDSVYKLFGACNNCSCWEANKTNFIHFYENIKYTNSETLSSYNPFCKGYIVRSTIKYLSK